jgi:hypothetical protein
MNRTIVARTALLLGVFLTVSLLASCATSGENRRTRTNQDRLTREEMMTVDVNNLYDAVQRLRPRWLTEERRAGQRSFNLETGVVVYQNQTYLGGVDALRQWSRESAQELEWMDGAKASATLPGLGSRHVAGAIVIHTYTDPGGA